MYISRLYICTYYCTGRSLIQKHFCSHSFLRACRDLQLFSDSSVSNKPNNPNPNPSSLRTQMAMFFKLFDHPNPRFQQLKISCDLKDEPCRLFSKNIAQEGGWIYFPLPSRNHWILGSKKRWKNGSLALISFQSVVKWWTATDFLQMVGLVREIPENFREI